MTKRDKIKLAKICKESKNLADVLIRVEQENVSCSLTTIKKYWRIIHEKQHSSRTSGLL